MNRLKKWVYCLCRIDVYNYEENATVKYDGWIAAASDTAVHLTHVNGRAGTYVFEYSRIKKAMVYRWIDTDSITKDILFVCYQ